MHAIGSLVFFFLFKSFFIIFLDLIAKRGYFYVSQWMKNIYIFNYTNKQPIRETASS